ncbi:MAG: radical SAM-associated putative lipoprotein [Prevotellaceae bacterium]|jgi:putative lipoprotein (rSAM/lipoprotein system)|nr:radical SAM-associated putative lipoprotein [Prevotellaceae bacterium]
MNKEKQTWLTAVNRLLLGVLTVLGFTQCDGIGRVEYGTPTCDFKVKGKVQNEQEEVISNARVITRMLYDGKVVDYPPSDTLDVKADGTYEANYKGMLSAFKFRVVCQDPSGTYKADSTEVEVEPTGGDGHWYQGSDTKEVDFTLKKETDNE